MANAEMKKNGGEQVSLIRIFVAIDMPKNIRQEIVRVQETLRRLNLFEGMYVKPEQAHLTLMFIGYVEPVALAPIKKMLNEIVFAPITVTLGSLGLFANKHMPKIVWVDLIGQEIKMLARKIETRLSMGVMSPKRAFVSHTTLARIKSVHNLQDVSAALEKIRVEPVSATISEFVLKQSTLTAKGPVYIDLETYSAQ